jgi:hypothetical protein
MEAEEVKALYENKYGPLPQTECLECQRLRSQVENQTNKAANSRRELERVQAKLEGVQYALKVIAEALAHNSSPF